LPATFRIRGVFAAILAVSLFPFSQQDRLQQVRSRFERETDPVRRAKLMVPLEKVEFDQIEKQVSGSELSAALDNLREYENDATGCGKSLDALGVNAEKHSAGFKELEISVRESLRRLNNVLVSLSADEQKPFLEIRDDLDQLNRHLIKELFPSQPGNSPGAAKPKN